jgi:hypothetical protein
MPKVARADVLSELAQALTYDNFQSAVAKQPDDAVYEDCLHDVWAIMRRLEKD